LYNIESDEFENENIIQTSPEIVKNLEKTLEKIKSESNIEFDGDISDEETKKIEGELKRLGYI
jgi:pentose-5-phosphate-3-epimerase